eukprot:CAMPEP_0172609656 /NCGR_PEP_ID=MMETSP1068-20121228/29603_1 /TAXON_ID=35684 /ORGANISM="Pseudopedinella elastica, Strain CCMP716" /LENGTH=515 /DNA_ID=CAMNT_0013413219 /DNA_START=97 /DNA_END=1644 /DNA_ORIENTATION=+
MSDTSCSLGVTCRTQTNAQGLVRRLGLTQQARILRSHSKARATVAMAAGENHFDYLVIGAGSGGIASARRAAQWGAKVAVVERGALGGTCVNVGCVPKKVMFNAATIMEMMHAAKHYGFTGVTEGAKFDWKFIKDARDKYILRLNGIYSNNLKNSGVEVINGLASFSGPKEVAVGGAKYTADHVMIAVGGRPTMPDIPGIEHCVDSDGFFLMDKQPKKVAVVGAGYIAVELAGIFNALESDTSLFVRGEKALRRFDPILCDTLDTEMKKQGMTVVPGATPKAVVKESDGTLTLQLEDGTSHGGFEQVVMAIGRSPLVDPLQLDKAGVTTNSKGYIEADEFQNTEAAGVYALGDVCGVIELTPTAISAGRRLADRLFGEKQESKADFDMVPTVIFSHPTIGTCGLSEQDAKKMYGEDQIRVYTSTFVNLFYGPWQMEPSDKAKTAYKLVCLGEEEKVIGCHLIGMASDEVLQGFGVAMKMGATKADFDACVAIHPTAGEELVTMAPWGLKKNPSPP